MKTSFKCDMSYSKRICTVNPYKITKKIGVDGAAGRYKSSHEIHSERKFVGSVTVSTKRYTQLLAAEFDYREMVAIQKANELTDEQFAAICERENLGDLEE